MNAVTTGVRRNRHLVVPLVAIIVLLLLAAIRGPQLFTERGLAGAILVASPLILATLALTPVVLAGRGAIDLAVGPLVSFVNVTLVVGLVQNGVTHPVLIFGFAILTGVAFQVFQALVILYVRIAPIIVSLAGYLILSGINLVILQRPSGVAPPWISDWGSGTEIFSPVFYVLLSGIAIWFLVSRSPFFTNLRLTGADERAAYVSGVRIYAVRIIAHCVSGVFIGLAAICFTALIGSADPTAGNNFTLQAITALVLGGASLSGGRGGGVGSILGAINMYLISYVLSTFNFGAVSGFATQLAFGTILVASLLINVLINKRREAS